MPGKKIVPRNEPLVSLGDADRYRLVRLVAEDSLGQVWQGQDGLIGTPVTIRIIDERLTEDPAHVDAFRRRLGTFCQRIAHPSLAWIYNYNEGEDGPLQFVVMEEMRGQTLAQRLRLGPGLRARQGFGIAAAVAEGLQSAHDIGVAHGALTADSIMLNDDGSVKVMDFGLAELGPPRPDGASSKGAADDVLALGSLLREMSGNRLPGAGSGDVKAEPGVELVRLWRASLDRDVRSRPTAGELARGLREVVDGPGMGSEEASEAPEVELAVGEPVGEEAAKAPHGHVGPASAETASRTAADERPELDREEPEEGPAEEAPVALRGSVEEARAQREADREARRRTRMARREAAAAEKIAKRHADRLQRAEDAVRRLEVESQTAADRARAATGRLERAREALERAEADLAKHAGAVAQAEEVARREDQRRAKAVARSDEATRRAEAARAAATAHQRVRAGAVEQARRAQESIRAEESRSLEMARSLAQAIEQRDQAAKASHEARESSTLLAEATEGAEGAPGGAPGGPTAVAALWSTAREWIPTGRRLLGLVALLVVTATVVFLLARSAAQPAVERPPATPQGGSTTQGVGVMPELRGLTESEALLRLEETGLILARRVEVQGEPGVVVATEPGLGQPVSPGTEVTLFIGQGQAEENAADF